ncbi:MAG: PEP-CTERM sorting domain-containing protein [Gemmatimonadales bacterium]
MRTVLMTAGMLLLGVGAASAQQRQTILFIGNSFTFGSGSAVRYWHADAVTDLNDEGIGGVPALFASFADQAGLAYDVYLETRGGSGFEFHLAEKRAELSSRPWDVVVVHGQSMLDLDVPRDTTKFLQTAQEMADFLKGVNPRAQIYYTATWSRADETYPEDGAWHGSPIEVMARDVRAAYDIAKSREPAIKSINPVGEAWNRAFRTGVADPNPYDGVDANKLNLWTFDSYHASTAGYYLHALVVFGNVTGIDPRSLGRGECSGHELGLSAPQVEALQQVAYDELTAQRISTRAPADREPATRAARCSAM